MSADLLRRAATVLRERAEAVDGAESWVRYYAHIDDADGRVMAPAAGIDDQRFIATMHPGVGLALADWLDLVARLLTEGFDPNAETASALEVARQIFGESS